MSRALPRTYEGSSDERFALRDALRALSDNGTSDHRIAGLVLSAKDEGRIPRYPKSSKATISRATIQRIRTASDEELAGVRFPTMALLYNFLTHAEELQTALYNEHTRVRSGHHLAPVLESVIKHLGARRGPLQLADLRSLEGAFYSYRKAWTSPNHETYVRCVLQFDWMGEALFYTETQDFYDPFLKVPVKEVDEGVVVPFGMNIVLLGHSKEKDLMKFFSMHEIFPFPDGLQAVQTMQGNFIAVYNKGPHPGFKLFAHRVPDDEEPKTAFYMPGELDEMILRRL